MVFLGWGNCNWGGKNVVLESCPLDAENLLRYLEFKTNMMVLISSFHFAIRLQI